MSSSFCFYGPSSAHIYALFFFLTIRLPPISTLFPYATLFRSRERHVLAADLEGRRAVTLERGHDGVGVRARERRRDVRSEEHTSELQSRQYLVCSLLLEKTDTAKPRIPEYGYNTHIRGLRPQA